MQVEYLAEVTRGREVMVWDINPDALEDYKADRETLGYRVQTVANAEDIAARCNLIVTVTPATAPLLFADMIRPGMHSTAVGSDTPEKTELDPGILQKADIVVADRISQCLLRGKIHHAIKAGVLDKARIVELGNVITHPSLRRSSETQITMADLTGVAVQDIQIAKAMYQGLREMAYPVEHSNAKWLQSAFSVRHDSCHQGHISDPVNGLVACRLQTTNSLLRLSSVC